MRKKILWAAVIFATAPALAQDAPMHVYEEGALSIRLMRGACTHEQIVGFVSQAGPQYTDRLRSVESTWPHRDGSRRDYAGCWFELSAEEGGAGEALIVLLFSDGDRFVIPKKKFLRGKGTDV